MSFSIVHILNTLEKDHSSVPKYREMDRTDTLTVFLKIITDKTNQVMIMSTF